MRDRDASAAPPSLERPGHRLLVELRGNPRETRDLREVHRRPGAEPKPCRPLAGVLLAALLPGDQPDRELRLELPLGRAPGTHQATPPPNAGSRSGSRATSDRGFRDESATRSSIAASTTCGARDKTSAATPTSAHAVRSFSISSVNFCGTVIAKHPSGSPRPIRPPASSTFAAASRNVICILSP